jgi:hypothetical protein
MVTHTNGKVGNAVEMAQRDHLTGPNISNWQNESSKAATTETCSLLPCPLRLDEVEKEGRGEIVGEERGIFVRSFFHVMRVK